MGPTASGKSTLALALAEKMGERKIGGIGGEIVNADSRQIYRGFDAGTAKPSQEDMERVPHHLYDFLNPEKPYSAGEYAREATSTIDSILNRGKVPIIVGGTGLYLQSLLNGISKLPERNESIRKNLLAFAEKFGRKALHERLEKVDSQSAGKIPYPNIQRVIRALEVYEITGKSLSRHCAESQALPLRHAAELFGISWDREALKHRIRKRCLATAPSMIEETQRHLGQVKENAPAFQGLGYRSALKVVRGEITSEEFLTHYTRETEQYAKRQMTWFRKDPRIHWISAKEPWNSENAAADLRNLILRLGVKGISDSRVSNGTVV